jgi:hypothetical protein
LKVIWVLENIKDDEGIYGKLNTLMLIASIQLWKKNHPTDNCVMYCDKLTLRYLERLSIGHLWDSIEEYTHTRNIDRTVFWAASKVAVLSQQTEPVILMDNDTLVYKPITHLLDKDTTYVCNLEKGRGYYPTGYDEIIKKLSYRPRWKTDSLCVAFLHLPDPEFTKLYANMSLDMMEELTALGAPNPQYLIFAEQLFLRHLLEVKQKTLKGLIKTYWDCQAWEWAEDHEDGLWTYEESQQYFKHYGPLKSWIIRNEGDQNYDRVIKELENCVNMPNLDLSHLTVM